MKTTIDIADALLAEAKEVAERQGITLKALVERSLRETLRPAAEGQPFRLRRVTFRGDGLHPLAGEGSWERIRDLVYEGRGA